MGILEKIAEIEREISRTQKNKGNFIISCVIMSETHVVGKIYLVNMKFFLLMFDKNILGFDIIEKQLNHQ